MSLGTRTGAIVALLFFALLAPLQATAALNFYCAFTLNGTAIEGESTAPGFEGAIELEGFSVEAVTEEDERTGASSQRRVRPVRIMKRIDQTSPLLFEAWATGARIDSAEIHIVKTDDEGTSSSYIPYTLTNVYIAAIETKADVKDSDAPPMEELTIVFETIEWTFESDGDSISRSWSAR